MNIPAPLNSPIMHRPHALQAHPIVRETRVTQPQWPQRDYTRYSTPAHARLYPGRVKFALLRRMDNV